MSAWGGRRSPGLGRAPDRRRGWRREWGLLLLVVLVSLPLFTPRIYASDEIKYFVHLRSVYFDGDLDYADEYGHFLRQDPEGHAGLRPFFEHRTATGRRLNDAPIGSAVMWAPFYVVADLSVAAARGLGAGIPRDGYSWPYVLAVCVGSLVWGLAGLMLSFRLARELYDRSPARIAVLGIWFASPVVFYLYITPPMAHANSLFAATLFLFVWAKTREGRTVAEWALLGAAAALAVLVRELNWLLVAVVGVELVHDLWQAVMRPGRPGRPSPGTALSRAVRFAVGRLPGLSVFAVALVALVTPQFLVYRALHGTWSPTPFVVEKFSWLPVHAGEVLFSSFHGLFTWSPILLLATVGLLLVFRRDPLLAAAATTVFVLQVLVIGSYATWWGGASFGARRFLNCTPIFVVGLAALIQSRGPGARGWARWVVLLLVLWNFGLAVQYSTGMIPRDRPVSLTTIAENQVTEVPRRILDVGWRFLVDRSSFWETR